MAITKLYYDQNVIFPAGVILVKNQLRAANARRFLATRWIERYVFNRQNCEADETTLARVLR